MNDTTSPPPPTELVMGGPSAASDLVGRRVSVWHDCPVYRALRDHVPVRCGGTVRAVGCGSRGMQIWVEQELDAGPGWDPIGALFSASPADGDGILLLPEDPPP